MKKITVLLVLILIASVAYASTLLSFSGNCTLVAGSGRTIRKTVVEIDDRGIVVIGEDEKVTGEGDRIKVVIGKDTIAALIDEGDVFTLYVVRGEGAVSTTQDRRVRIYTPTSLTEAEGKGDYYVRSTDEEEYIFNHSSSDVVSYDALRGTYTTIKADEGLDYMTNKAVFSPTSKEKTEDEITDSISETAEKNKETSLTVKELNIPSPPVFVTVEENINTPAEPVITEAERVLTVPAEPVLEVRNNTLEEEDEIPSTPSVRVKQELVDVPDESGN